MSQNPEDKIFTIPNILSLLRVIAIPFFIWAYTEEFYETAAIIALASAVTDVIDGFIARTFHMVSTLGKALDPIADKLSQISIAIMLCTKFRIMILLLSLLIFKEIIQGIVSLEVVKKTGTTYSSLWYGKLSTVLIYSTFILHLFWIEIPYTLSQILNIACDIMMVISLILYMIRNYKVLRQPD